jgi:hypothetical protein
MPTSRSQQSSEHVEKEKAKPRWVDPCFVIGGVACDWYLAFEWFSEKYSLFSGAVIRAAALAVVLCALVTILAARVLGANLRESAAGFAIGFSLVSFSLLLNLLMWWTTHR